MTTLFKKFAFIIVGTLMLNNSIYSQDEQILIKEHQNKTSEVGKANIADLGIGFGLDYGGMGFQLGFTAAKRLTFFAAGGYYKQSAGWNIGIKTLLIAKTTVHAFRPFVKAMYGTHSAIVIEGIWESHEVYNGFTIGLGAEFRIGKKKVDGFDLDLNIPLRTQEFWSDYNEVLHRPGMQITVPAIPIAGSIGFHHEF